MRLSGADGDLLDREHGAERVRQPVERSGLTQRDFAEVVGTSPSLLSTYASGKVTPSAAMLVRMERMSEGSGAEW